MIGDCCAASFGSGLALRRHPFAGRHGNVRRTFRRTWRRRFGGVHKRRRAQCQSAGRHPFALRSSCRTSHRALLACHKTRRTWVAIRCHSYTSTLHPPEPFRTVNRGYRFGYQPDPGGSLRPCWRRQEKAGQPLRDFRTAAISLTFSEVFHDNTLTIEGETVLHSCTLVNVALAPYSAVARPFAAVR